MEDERTRPVGETDGFESLEVDDNAAPLGDRVSRQPRRSSTDRLLIGLATLLAVAVVAAGVLAYQVVMADHVPVSLADQRAQTLRAAITENPDDLGSYFALADLYYQLGDYRKAADILQDIRQRGVEGRTLAETLNGIALVERGRGNDEEALDSLLASLEVTETARARYEIGALYLDRGEYGDAVESLERFVELEPTNVDGLKALAQAFEADGEAQRALTIWKEVLRFVPDDEEALGGVERLEENQ